MQDLQVRFRDNEYKVSFEMEPINWINVYIVFVKDSYLINLLGKEFFHVLQVTTEQQNVYWYSSKKAHDNEANEFKRTVAHAIRGSYGESL